MDDKKELVEAVDKIAAELKRRFGEYSSVHIYANGSRHFAKDGSGFTDCGSTAELADLLMPEPEKPVGRVPTDEDAKRRAKVEAWDSDIKRSVTGTLAIVVPDVPYPFYVNCVRGVECFAHARLIDAPAEQPAEKPADPPAFAVGDWVEVTGDTKGAKHHHPKGAVGRIVGLSCDSGLLVSCGDDEWGVYPPDLRRLPAPPEGYTYEPVTRRPKKGERYITRLGDTIRAYGDHNFPNNPPCPILTPIKQEPKPWEGKTLAELPIGKWKRPDWVGKAHVQRRHLITFFHDAGGDLVRGAIDNDDLTATDWQPYTE